jgi:ABC-type dipeptide/oligopeptide/nickel transport system permease component
MVSYITKRILTIIPIVLLAILVMFVFIQLSPVDPAEAYLTAANIHPTEELLAEINAGIEARLDTAGDASREIGALLGQVDFGPFDEAMEDHEHRERTTGEPGA